MINHLRTLLLNEPQPDSRVLGDEYVPASYVPRSESPLTTRIRQMLFGTNTDRMLKNYRLAQLLPLIHGSELQRYSDDLDPRLTYWPSTRESDFRGLAGSVTVEWSGSAPYYSVLGADSPQSGPMYRSWSVTRLTSTTVQVNRLFYPISSEVLTIDPGPGLTAVPLPGSHLTLSADLVVGNQALITSLVPPTTTLSQVAVALESGLSYQDLELLLPDPDLRTLWFESNDLGLKLGALCIGTATLTEGQGVLYGV